MNRDINIWPEDGSVSLRVFGDECAAGRPAVIVLPGGGYNVCAPREADPVAEHFAKLGYAAFVLRYSTLYGSFENKGGAKNSHCRFPEPLRQLAAALRYLRENAAELGVDPRRIFLMGFSAGGHLAACYCGVWSKPEISGGDELCRPDGCALIYAATEPEKSSMMLPAMLGEKAEYTADEILQYTPKALAGSHTPPTVLFHSVADPMVPFSESCEYFAALQKNGVVSEMHLFGCGGHAYGLGRSQPQDIWPELAHRFLQNVFSRPELYDREQVKENMFRR